MCQENQATNGHRMLRNDGQVEGGENDRFGRHRSDVARLNRKGTVPIQAVPMKIHSRTRQRISSAR